MANLQPTAAGRGARLAVIAAALLLLTVTVFFLLEFFLLSRGRNENRAVTLPPVDVLEAEALALVAVGDVSAGADHIVTYACNACHVLGVENRLAPGFSGLKDVAADRQPPLSAAAHVYTSIVYPTAHEVEGYTGAMPWTYGTQIPQQALADLVVYLLSDEVDALYQEP